MMKDIPIIFSAPMVRALLDGRKTMTRRLAWRAGRNGAMAADGDGFYPTPWQKVRPGDRLYVRENWKACQTCGGATKVVADPIDDPLYCAECKMSLDTKLRPSIHMPRWASRLTLAVTATKIEKLQDISDADARAEGVGWDLPSGSDHLQPYGFRALWSSLHGEDSWLSNPEVVALTFTVHNVNIDQVAEEAA